MCVLFNNKENGKTEPTELTLKFILSVFIFINYHVFALCIMMGAQNAGSAYPRARIVGIYYVPEFFISLLPYHMVPSVLMLIMCCFCTPCINYTSFSFSGKTKQSTTRTYSLAMYIFRYVHSVCVFSL